MIRCSRPMSWALASTWPSGGRRSTYALAVGVGDADVRLEWPPAMRSNVNGPRAPATLASNQAVTGATSMPRHRARSHRPPPCGTVIPPVSLPIMAIDVTDATFETEVLERSNDAPVVVDLWAPWCGRAARSARSSRRSSTRPTARSCWSRSTSTRTPAISQAFQVQSIPAVYALKDGAGRRRLRRRAIPEHVVAGVRRQPAADRGRAEPSRRWWPRATRQPAAPALRARARQRGRDRRPGRAARRPGDGERGAGAAGPHPRDRAHAAGRRAGPPRRAAADTDDYDAKLTALLDQVKTDDEARQEFVDILELMGPDDPRTAEYRKQLTSPPLLTSGVASRSCRANIASTSRWLPPLGGRPGAQRRRRHHHRLAGHRAARQGHAVPAAPRAGARPPVEAFRRARIRRPLPRPYALWRLCAARTTAAPTCGSRWRSRPIGLPVDRSPPPFARNCREPIAVVANRGHPR